MSQRTSGHTSQQMADMPQSQPSQPPQPPPLSLPQLPPRKTSGHMTRPCVSYAQAGLGRADTALAKHRDCSVSSHTITQNNGTESAAEMRQDPGYGLDSEPEPGYIYIRQINTYLDSLKSSLRSSHNQMASNKESRNLSKQFRENKANLEYFTTRIMSVTSATLEIQETLSSL